MTSPDTGVTVYEVDLAGNRIRQTGRATSGTQVTSAMSGSVTVRPNS